MLLYLCAWDTPEHCISLHPLIHSNLTEFSGTSTDVSRYAGSYEHVFESTTAGVTIQAPQLDINTVAAGGGSMLFFRSGLFVVGPESAGAHPGPVCYRKGLSVWSVILHLGCNSNGPLLKSVGHSLRGPFLTSVGYSFHGLLFISVGLSLRGPFLKSVGYNFHGPFLHLWVTASVVHF